MILSGLPGHPDNIRTANDGTFWVALSAPLMEKLFPLLPYKCVLAWGKCYVQKDELSMER